MMTGVGALYLRRRPRVRVVPIQSGGGQERGIRSGTVPTPLTVGLGAACELAQQEMNVSEFSNNKYLYPHMLILLRAIYCSGVCGPSADRFVRFWASGKQKLKK